MLTPLEEGRLRHFAGRSDGCCKAAKMEQEGSGPYGQRVGGGAGEEIKEGIQ